MTPPRLFLDSNLFLSYAIDFEPDHALSERLFHEDYARYSGIRVKSELGKVKRRRRNLYEDLMRFYNGNASGSFRPSLALLPNDRHHLAQLLKSLVPKNKVEVLTLLRRLGRLIDLGVDHAFSLISSPLVSMSTDLACQKQIELCVANAVDAWLLTDALCWTEEDAPASFCTEDWSDIVANRAEIYARICSIRAYAPTENPLKIVGLRELIV